MLIRTHAIPQSALVFVEDLAHNPLVDAIILFGSRAVGDEDERSDVDLAICGPKISDEEWTRIRLSGDDAQTLYRFTLVHFDRNPETLQKRILETGVFVYDRQKAAWSAEHEILLEEIGPRTRSGNWNREEIYVERLG